MAAQTAIAQWQGNPNRHRPTRWGVLHEGRVYPPKILISYANLYANGHVYLPSLFHGGRETNRFLRARGFELVELEQWQQQNYNHNQALSF
ncbi:MAG TPA: hypothetical protein V6C57_21700 [Coleofasciculaceae cyanobacterium]